MFSVELFLLGAILGGIGLILKWEYRRAKRGPRFNPAAWQRQIDQSQEGTGPVYVPPGGAIRAFEHNGRR
jgi:hypothetical protein